MAGWLWETYTKMTGMIPMLSQGRSSSKENWFTGVSLPGGGAYNGLGYNGSVWAAVSAGSTQAASSTNGITWTSRTSSSANGWSGVGNVGSTFCSVSSAGAQTSTDGITWTARSMPSSQGYTLKYHYSGITPNGFLAVSGGYGAYSTNGVTWTEVAWPNSRNWNYAGVAWNGSTWCFVVDNFSYWCYTSPNGTTWTERRMPIKSLDYDQEGSYFSGPAWNGTHFIVIRGYGDDVIRSTDGITWTEADQPTMSNRWYYIANPQYVPFMGNGTFASTHGYAGDAWATTNGTYWRRLGIKKGQPAGLWQQTVYSPTMLVMITNSHALYATYKNPGSRS